MTALKNLREQNKEIGDLLLESSGYGLWTVWEGEANPVFFQTLEDYGGIKVLSDSHQALWFFFSLDVFLACAKLGVWAQFNSLSVIIQLFKADIKCSSRNQYQISIAEELWSQNLPEPAKFTIYASADAIPQNSALSSLSFNEIEPPKGFSARPWRQVVADQRPSYKPLHNWYCVLRPVSTHQDKNFQIGWRDFYERMDNILQRNKLRHLVHDNFLMMPLASLRQLKQWCHDYLSLVHRLKVDEGGVKYWPCVMAFIDSKGVPFNNEMYKQLDLDWSSMMPDSPYLALSDAVLLGGEFEIHESYLGLGKKTPESWCSISLAAERSPEYLLPALTPGAMIYGQHKHCFYCGQRSHESANCPSRPLTDPDYGIWSKIAACDVKTMRDGTDEINARLERDPGSLEALLQGEDKAGLMTRGIYGVCANMQLRSAPQMWRVRGKNYPQSLRDLKGEDDSPMWAFLQNMRERDRRTLDKELDTLRVRFPRDARVFSVHGFVAMELGDFKKAKESWENAMLLSQPGLMQAWHLLLLGRLDEYQGHYTEAGVNYDKMREAAPTWLEAGYRKLICLIKSGFINQIDLYIKELIEKDPNFFNWLLLDPEIERGATAVREFLSRYWEENTLRLKEEKAGLGALLGDLQSWFVPENEFFVQAKTRLDKLSDLSSVENFVPHMMVIRGRAALEKDMQSRITHESKVFKERFGNFVMRLGIIRDEAAWFPFPRILVEFNRNYNHCAANINWVLTSNLRTPDVFRRAQELSVQEEERIIKLEKRLKLLRIVRDGTLFALIVIKKFLWMEIAGLALILVIFPLLIFYGDKIGLDWISRVFVEEQWAIQKAAILVVSCVSLAVSCFWTILGFEKVREKTFEKARQEEAKRAAERAKKMEKERNARRGARRAVRGTTPHPQGARGQTGRPGVRTAPKTADQPADQSADQSADKPVK
ncbi:MAG: tetratricopeptide repeat protein [Deltaproteobacteria bacterium]|jgi:tetratricopeptide (TPR) repeat protein|nr:tetratricopeptide repeat protein [Deltaproteobacteria bacterium]